MLNLISWFTAGRNMAVAAVLMLILRLPIVFISLSLHESAHGYSALKCGDPTARNFGRISLNPFRHFDPIGTLCMIVFGIGWAKPVPINSRNFKKPKRDIAITAAAGPLSNLFLGFISMFLLRLLDIILFDSGYPTGGYAIILMVESTISLAVRLRCALLYFFEMAAFMNISLALFNLIPIPPFDGSRIAFALLPDKIYFGVMKYERYIMIIFLILFYFFGGWLSDASYYIFNGIYDIFKLIG